MKASTRKAIYWGWGVGVVFLGSLGAPNLTVMRIANAAAALGFALLGFRALRRGRTAALIAFWLLAAAFVILAALVQLTAPTWEFLGDFLEDV